MRLLPALLACLAVLVAAVPVVAWAWAPAASPVMKHFAADEPCNHCPDCDGAPCQPAANGCVAVCIVVPPALGVTSFTLAMLTHHGAVWPMRIAALLGLSPPPDPLPPRS